MQDTKSLRVEAMNIWPARIQFPFEKQVDELLASHNLVTPITACKMKMCESTEFHKFLSSILDGFDSLPRRPDRAFESLWIPIDVEMGRLKGNSGSNDGRFKVFIDHLKGDVLSPEVKESLFDFLGHAPLQACEYAAQRILEAIDDPGPHSQPYVQRIKAAVGADFADDFAAKYLPRIRGETPRRQAEIQRKAGSFIRNVMLGKVMDLEGRDYGADPYVRLAMFASVILPNIRNERFHGAVFSSYRSSARQMKHYASDCFTCALVYHLVLVVLSYRWPEAIDQKDVAHTIKANADRFLLLFERNLGD